MYTDVVISNIQSMRVDITGFLNEIVTRMEEDGIFDREAYHDMVDEVLEEKRETGILTDDDNIEEMGTQLKQRWPEAEAMFVSGHDNDAIEGEE